MKVNTLFHLSEIDESFAGYNLQSVCVRADKSSRLKLYLLANSKAGISGAFTIRIKD